MKKLLTLLAILILPAVSMAEGAYKEITAKELQKMQAENPKLLVIDARSNEYLGDGTIIKGAVVKPTSEITKEYLTSVAKENDPIVFYCTNTDCPASKQAAHKAAELGFKNLYKFPGGIDEWKENKLPTDKVEVKAETKTETK